MLTLEHVTMRARHRHKPLLDDVSFSVRRGEIVTIAGIDGNGQSELVYAVSGSRPSTAGAS